MTSNARSASRRGDRSRDTGRRTLFTNLAFGLIVLAAFLILAAAAGASYYGDHLAAVATVDGHTINKDDLRDRFSVDVWRLNELESQLRDAVSTGRITKDQSDQQIAQIDQAKQDQQTILSQSLQNLVDAQLQSELAAKMGITVTPADIDAKLLDEATRPEARDVWVIEFQPDVTAPATTPTPIQTSVALGKANAALAQLKAGTAWETVAKQSTDTDRPGRRRPRHDREGQQLARSRLPRRRVRRPEQRDHRRRQGRRRHLPHRSGDQHHPHLGGPELPAVDHRQGHLDRTSTARRSRRT